MVCSRLVGGHNNFLTSASASCQFCGLSLRSAPRVPRRCRLVFSRRFDGKCQHLSPWSVRAFRSYDSGSDAFAEGRLVTTHRVTPRTAVYQRSSLIKGEEVRRVPLASKCFHFRDDKIKRSLFPLFDHIGLQHHCCFLCCLLHSFLSSSTSNLRSSSRGGSIYHCEL